MAQAASITVKPNGQTLVVNFTGQGSAVSFYSDAALTSSVTLPYTVTADTTFYTGNFGQYTISVKQPDGTELDGSSRRVQPDVPLVIEPMPTNSMVAADLASSFVAANAYTGGYEVFPRWATSTTAMTATSQVLRWTAFTATASFTVGSLQVMTHTTAAGATPTICRLGLYTVNADGGFTLVASTTNDTTLFSGASTLYTKALTSNYAVTSGVRYALGCLVVTAATAPTFVSAQPGIAQLVNLTPKLSGGISGQADLPASVVAANTNTLGGNGALWGALVAA